MQVDRYDVAEQGVQAGNRIASRKQGWLYQAVIGDAGISPDAMSVDLFSTRLGVAISGLSMATVELNELGRALYLERAYGFARVCYELAAQDARALGAQVNLGQCEIRLGRPHDAELRARSLLATNASFVPGWQLLGESLTAQGHHFEAREALQHAVSVATDNSALQALLGDACKCTKDYEAACVAYECALSLNPHDIRSLSTLVYNKRRLCDWNRLEDLSARLKAAVAKGTSEISPFGFLLEGVTAAEELVCARARATKVHAMALASPMPWAPFVALADGKLRVGIVSCGLGAHPMAILTLALFEQLKGTAVELHLFSTGTPSNDAQWQRMVASAHRFHEVSHLSPRALADKVREAGVEILFETDGYCNGRVPQVAPYRAAPIQANWVGYPGTIGGSFTDYLIADRFVLPESLLPHFSEQVVYLDRCYLCIDPTRAIGKPPSRELCGLPPRPAVVYACFNASYKINPRSFARMMRILRDVPDSVLWLLSGPGRADERLREAAHVMGGDPGRLVFMKMLPHLRYMACYQHVDLFLDTEHYNAHTTASDALWAGCPVLTRPGGTFATRVAGSLNHHLGMDDMNVCSDDDFVTLAIRYGRDAEYRAGMRERLVRQKRRSELFDVAGYARDFVALLMRLSAHHRAGGVPSNFSINDEVSPS